MEELIKIGSLAISKASAEKIRETIANSIEEGMISPVHVMAAIKFYEKVFKGDDKKNNGLIDLIKSKVLDEVEKDKARKDWFGFGVQVRESGVNYIYDKCNDDVLIELLEEEKNLKKKIEERKDFLKAIKGHIDIITENGEVRKLFPPAKSSTTSPTFTLK